jgi:3-oxoacyl-[acyl-carrier-protein] synthase II
MRPREVWVTGLGAVTGAGIGTVPLAELLVEGRSAVRRDEGAAAARPPRLPTSRITRRLDPAAALFFTAGLEAWQDAGLSTPPDPRRTDVIEGSSLGPLTSALEEQARSLRTAGPVRPTMLIRCLTGAGAAALALELGIRGSVYHLSAGSVSATAAIGEAARRIARGECDLAVTGGGESTLHPMVMETFRGAGILADDGVCCPFDPARHGTVLGEGAGAMVLEAAECAERRGARPRAVIAGFGSSSEVYDMTAPDPAGTGIREAAEEALAESGVEEVGWIKAHGTGTLQGDAAEAAGLAELFGGDLSSTPVTSLKPTLGHCLGASGAVEAVGAVLALGLSMVPATLGTREIDPALPLRRVALRPVSSRLQSALLLSEGFGSRAAAMVILGGDGR